MTQAGSSTILTPSYDSQHDVYQHCLALLDTANSDLAAIQATEGSNTVAGDIYGLKVSQ